MSLFHASDQLFNDMCSIACAVVTIALTTLWLLAVGVYKLIKCIVRTSKEKREQRQKATAELARENAACADGTGNVGGVSTEAGGGVPQNCTSGLHADFKSVPTATATPPAATPPPKSAKKPFGSFFQKDKPAPAPAPSPYADDSDDDIEKGASDPYQTPPKATPAADPADEETPQAPKAPASPPTASSSPPAPAATPSPGAKARRGMGKNKFMSKSPKAAAPPTSVPAAAPFAPWWAEAPAAKKSAPAAPEEDPTETTASTEHPPEEDSETPVEEQKAAAGRKEPTADKPKKPKKKKKKSKTKTTPDESGVDDGTDVEPESTPEPNKPKTEQTKDYDTMFHDMKDKKKKKKKKSAKKAKKPTADDGIGIPRTTFDDSEADFSEVTDTDDAFMHQGTPIPTPAL
jgi:hypothetical protein